MFAPFSPIDIRVLSKDAGFDAVRDLTREKKGVLILADGFLLDSFQCRVFFEELIAEQSGALIDEIPANPGVEAVAKTLDALKDTSIDVIVALGGGSCIDMAKAVSALKALAYESVSVDDVRALIAEKRYLQNTGFIDIIALPTTAGTGSEVTKWATIWDMTKNKKLSIDCHQLFPKAAIVIPELTEKMPQRLTLSTGLDALSHAMEAYWAKVRTPLSQALAYAAIERLRIDLPIAVNEGKSRDKMSLNALLAGLAFSITRTTACHSISYPLTMGFSVPHGFAAALTLSPVMDANEKAVPEIAKLKALFEPDGGFISWLYGVAGSVQPLTLGAFGISEADIGGIVEGAFTVGRMDNNPVSLTKDEVKKILNGCL